MVNLTRQFGRLIPVQGKAVLNLQDEGVSFVAVFIGTDPVSRSFENILTDFLVSHTAHHFIVKVVVDNHIAQQLAISYVPQLRMYIDGKEIQRHRGSADYDTLNRILRNG